MQKTNIALCAYLLVLGLLTESMSLLKQEEQVSHPTQEECRATGRAPVLAQTLEHFPSSLPFFIVKAGSDTLKSSDTATAVMQMCKFPPQCVRWSPELSSLEAALHHSSFRALCWSHEEGLWAGAPPPMQYPELFPEKRTPGTWSTCMGSPHSCA